MERMPIFEAMEYLAFVEYRNRDTWEQTRMITHITAQVNSKKTLKKTDIAAFPWDIKEESEPTTEADLKRLKEKAEFLEKKLYG